MTDEYTQEELNLAAAAENQEMSMSPTVLQAQNKHLSDRVIILRAELERLKKQLEKPTPRAPQDHKPRARKPKAK